jgi:hypothetical protein
MTAKKISRNITPAVSLSVRLRARMTVKFKGE